MLFNNELIFISHCLVVSILAAVAARFGKTALASLACLYAVLANLFVLKQTVLLGLCVTCTDAYSVGSGIILNLTQEYFGPQATKKVIYLSLAALIIFVVLAQFQILYLPDLSNLMPHAILNQPSTHSSQIICYQEIYQILLTQAPRILCASLCAFAISQNLDAVLYRYFNRKFSHKYFILRNYSSLLISQLIDTALFTVLGLTGTFSHLWELFFFSYLVKVATIAISIPVVSLCKK